MELPTWSRIATLCVIICTILVIYSAYAFMQIDTEYVNDEILSSNDVLSKEHFFMRPFLTESQVKQFLSNTTLLYASANNNQVAFASADHRISVWNGLDIRHGTWSVHSKIRLLMLNWKLRLTDIQVVCSTIDGQLSIDNCSVADSYNTIFAWGQLVQIETGDPLHLAGKSSSPFALPQGPTTIQQISELLQSHGR